MAIQKSVLLAITSYFGPFYDDGAKTGLFYSELAHPYHVYTKAGYKVQFVSETGTYGMDEHSVSSAFATQEELDEYNNKDSDIRKALDSTKKASEVDAKDYGIFYAAGGHGTLFDFPSASTLQKLAADIYLNGGIVSAVCHGPAIFENLKDASGVPLIKGKKVTAFTDLAEGIMGLGETLPKYNLKTCQAGIDAAGGIYVPPTEPFADFVVSDGRIASGSNPASAGSLATKTIEILDTL